MANNQMLTSRQVVIDYNAEYGYPTTAMVFEFGNAAHKYHIIFDTAGVSDPTTNYASAPNGTEIHDFVNGFIHQKRGTDGLTNGTWYKQAIATAE